MDTAINIGFIILYALMIAAVIGVIVFPLIQMLSDLKSAKGALIGIGAILVVFLISYAISTPEVGAVYDKYNVSPNFSKVIGGGLIATYIMFAGVIVSILWSQISSWLK